MSTKKRQKGFALIEILVGIAILGLLCITTWLVYDRNQSEKNNVTSQLKSALENTVKPTEATDVYAGWSTYKDEYVTFKHPKDWTVSKQASFSDPYGALLISLRAPVDNSLTAANASIKDIYLDLNIIIAKDGRFGDFCAGCGQVLYIEPVETADNGKSNLIIADSGNQGKPDSFDLVGDTVAVGDKSYQPSGFRIGSSYSVRIQGSYMSGSTSLISFKTVEDIKDSKQYGLLRNLIKTVHVEAGNLPQ